VTGDEFRALALSLDGAVERAHMNHPDFRANGKIFATLRADERAGVIRLSADEQRELIRQQPRVFEPASGAWGRQGWTVVHLSAAEAAGVRAAMILAWQHVVETARRRAPPKPAARPRARASRKRRL
jgi:hypothetical protein